MRIHHKYILVALCAALLPLTVAMFVAVFVSTAPTRDVSVRLAQSLVWTSAERFNAFLAERLSEIQLLAQMPVMRTMNFEQIGPVLQSELRRQHGVYEKFILGRTDGYFYNTAGGNLAYGGLRTYDDTNPQANPRSLAQREYWQITVGDNAANESRSYISNPMISYTTGVGQIVVAATILGDGGKVVGMIGGGLDSDRIANLVNGLRKDLEGEFEAQSNFVVTTASGDFLYHWQPEKIIHPKRASEGKLVRDERGEVVAEHVNIVDDPQPELAAAGRALRAGNSGYARYYDREKGKYMYFVYAPVRTGSYGIGLVIPESLVLSPVVELRFLLLLITVLVGAGILVTGPIMARWLTRPIVALADTARQIASGQRVTHHDVAGGDEVSSLVAAFNGMVTKLSQREAELEAARRELESKVEARTRELTAEQQKAQRYLDIVPVVLVAIRADGSVELINRRGCQTLGYPESEILGSPWIDKFVPRRLRGDERREFDRFIQSATQPIEHRESRVVCKDGGERLMAWARIVLKDSGGIASGVLFSGQDITVQRAAETALRHSQQLLDSAQSIAHLGAWEWDVVSDRVTWTDETYRIFGLEPSKDDIGYATYLKHVYPADQQVVSDMVGRAFKAGDEFQQSHRIVRPNGDVRYVRCKYRVFRDPQGAVTRMLGVIYDVTDQTKVDRMKRDFVSVVSHELRTPLTAIRGSLGLLVNTTQSKLDPTEQKLLSVANRNSERLVLLVNDILDVDKIENSKLQLTLESCDVANLLAHAVEANTGYAVQFNVNFVLVEHPRGVHVFVDRNRFGQIMANLLSNAAKFSSAGTPVEIGATASDDSVTVFVRDYGKGMSSDFGERVFEKFTQEDHSNARAGSGTGLGLHITKGLVEHMGGRIRFESAPGRGATFFITFPLAMIAETGAQKGTLGRS